MSSSFSLINMCSVVFFLSITGPLYSLDTCADRDTVPLNLAYYPIVGSQLRALIHLLVNQAILSKIPVYSLW